MKLHPLLATLISVNSFRQHVQSFDVPTARGSLLRKAKASSGKKGKDLPSHSSKQGKKEKTEDGFPDVGGSDPSQLAERATKLLIGTELFQDTIYSQPVVSQEDIGSHCLLEGARSYSRIQADLNATEQDEAEWLDAGYHQGPAELVQLELVEDDGGEESWELVHYRHPWIARADGGRADGLVRDVLMDKSKGLSNPKSVHCISGSYTNHIQTNADGQQVNTIAYALYVAQQSTQDDRILLGKGNAVWDSQSPPDYPVVWAHKMLGDFKDLGNVGVLKHVSRYVQTPWYSNMEHSNLAAYNAERGVEHLILYYKDQLVVLTLLDCGQTNQMEIALNKIHYQNGDNSGRVAHLDWTPDNSREHWARLETIVTVRMNESKGKTKYHIFHMLEKDSSSQKQYTFPGQDNYYTVVKWEDNGSWRKYDFEPVEHKTDSDYQIELQNLFDVHELYFIDGIDGMEGWNLHAKICNIKGRGVFILLIYKDMNGHYSLGGMFPLLFPDVDGVGVIESLNGGTSKFGGLRFIANDENGNLFMMRQRGVPSTIRPYDLYDLPIYGLYDGEGNPLRKFNLYQRDSLPQNTSSSSNLNNLYDWLMATTEFGNDVFQNILLNTALAFGTDETNVAQGLYFGTGYKASYAMKRFGMDSEHIVVRAVGSSDTDYTAISTFKNPFTRAWHKRIIANQVLPEVMRNETGDHYQAMLTFANYAGQAVSPSNEANEGLMIEVRGDSPCTVTDDTNGYYHHIDRYTSFMSKPDPSSGTLSLTVKADTFSQVLYARIVNATALQISSDNAILHSVDSEIHPWIAVNIAEKAQQRMSNGASSSNSTLADKTLYMSQQNLTDSNTNTPWQTKGGYEPTSSNMKDLSTYCTTSGANLLVATDELSMGGGADSINPLFSYTDIPQDQNRLEFTTRFSYGDGTISSEYPTSRSLRGPAVRQLNVFSSLSHDLHDALHYLQHVEGKVYKDLGSDGVAIAAAAEGLTVTVSKSIMKSMKGVDKALTQVVSTVEEYGSIVLNVIVTIVEDSFVFIEILISLLSMFLYFGDILKLCGSFAQAFEDLAVPTTQEFDVLLSSVSGYFGPDSQVTNALGGVSSDNVERISSSFMTDVVNNPVTKKIMHGFTTAIQKSIGAIDEDISLPFEFKMNVGPSLSDTRDTMGEAVEGLEQSTSTLIEIVDNIAGAVTDPNDFFKYLQKDLGAISELFGVEALESVFSTMSDDLNENGNDPFTVAKSMLDQKTFITLHLPGLASLLKLFGIGSWSGNDLKIPAKDAIFFPMAVIAWITVYTKKGKSISDVEAFMRDLEAGPNQSLAAADYDLWNEIRLFTDFIMKEVQAMTWVAQKNIAAGYVDPVKYLIQVGTWMAWMKWLNDVIYYYTVLPDPTGSDQFSFNSNAQAFNLALAIASVKQASRSTLSDENIENLTWLTNIQNALTITSTAYNAVEGASSDIDWVFNTVGKSIASSQGLWAFLYSMLSNEQKESWLDPFSGLVYFSPMLGYPLQIAVLEDIV